MWIEIILLLLILLEIFRIAKKPSNYPPGPWGLPLIGYIPLGATNFVNKFQDLRKKHGDIISWRIGTKLLVFLCDDKLIKEAFQSQTFVNRPDLYFFSSIDGEYKNKGVIGSNGLHWLNGRRFILRHLRDLGMGKSKLVTVVQFEAMEVVKEFQKHVGKPGPIPEAITPGIINILWQMTASKRYELDDENVFEIANLIQATQDNMAQMIIQDIFPWIKSLLPKKILDALTKYHLRKDLSNRMKRLFEGYINEHIETLDESNPRDLIDDYLLEMEKQKSDPDSTMSVMSLVACIADLFTAGLETTSVAICWSIFCLAKFPKIQNKLQNEIDDVLPNGILATLDDKPRLPYTEAFISEVLRYSSMSGMGAPHSAVTETTVGGFTIPKNALVFSVAEAVHFDERYFESPKEFRPERFLNSEGKFKIPKEGFIPFGIGKRLCIGESLARMQLLIFLTAFVQHFQFDVPLNGKIDLSAVENPLFRFPKRDQEILMTSRM